MMKIIWKVLIVIVLVIVVGAVVITKHRQSATETPAVAPSKSTPAIMADESSSPKALPRLVDLGADKCIPCKMMAPILEELKESCKGQLDVVFIDVWKNPNQAKKYNIKLIPTQIFYDAAGQELFRHEGFFSKEDILSKWKEFGVTLAPGDNPKNQ